MKGGVSAFVLCEINNSQKKQISALRIQVFKGYSFYFPTDKGSREISLYKSLQVSWSGIQYVYTLITTTESCSSFEEQNLWRTSWPGVMNTGGKTEPKKPHWQQSRKKQFHGLTATTWFVSERSYQIHWREENIKQTYYVQWGKQKAPEILTYEASAVIYRKSIASIQIYSVCLTGQNAEGTKLFCF